MSGDDNRALIERYLDRLEARDWKAWSALLDPDVVYEMPLSRERIRGLDRFLRFNQEYPGEWHLRRQVIVADAERGVLWFRWSVGDEEGDAIGFFEFRNGRVSRVTEFWPEPTEPGPGREHLSERY